MYKLLLILHLVHKQEMFLLLVIQIVLKNVKHYYKKLLIHKEKLEQHLVLKKLNFKYMINL